MGIRTASSMVEQLTLNQWVLGSNPRRCTGKARNLRFAGFFFSTGFFEKALCWREARAVAVCFAYSPGCRYVKNLVRHPIQRDVFRGDFVSGQGMCSRCAGVRRIHRCLIRCLYA